MSSKESHESKSEDLRTAEQAKVDGTQPVPTLCMSTADSSCDFHVTSFFRRKLGERDVLIKMKYCGVCHSDLHHAANHNHKFGETKYPCVPGHVRFFSFSNDNILRALETIINKCRSWQELSRRSVQKSQRLRLEMKWE